jgi:TusA-related sulfurtransferase
MLCPMPIVKLAQSVRGLSPGQVVEIRADDPGAAADVPAWCAKTGNEYAGSAAGTGYTSYFVRKR